MQPRTFFPIPLDGERLTCAATWASWGTHIAAIDIYFDGTVEFGANGQYQLTPGYERYPLRFEY